MPEQIPTQIVDAETWLTALSSREHALQLPMFGYTTVEPEWRFAPRVIPEHLVYFVVQNTCAGRVSDRLFRLDSGQISWIMPGAKQEAWVAPGTRPFKLYFFKLKLATAAGVCLRLAPDHIWQPIRWELRETMAEIVELLQLKRPGQQPYLRALLTVLFGRVLQGRTGRHAGAGTLSENQRSHIVRFVQQHPTGRLTARALASELRLSPDYFSRTFRLSFGVAPRRWLLGERIRLAAIRLSQPGLSVTEVAYQFGYENIYLFSRQFKQVMGLSPKKFQQTAGL